MSPSEKLNASWDAWNQVMRTIVSLMEHNDVKTALNEVNSFLSDDVTHEVRSDALGMRADLKEQLGDLDGAKNDLLNARSIIGPSYARYVHELALGAVCQKQRNVHEALSWYRSALQTCLDGDDISGGTALKQFFALSAQEQLTATDQELCSLVARRSWKVLALPGRPDQSDFTKIIKSIKEAEAKPPRKNDSRSS